MAAAVPTTPDARFAAIIHLLCQVVAARGGRGGLAGPLVVLVWRRLRRYGVRFAGLAARLAAGTLRPPRCRRVAAPAAETDAAPAPRRVRPAEPLPRGRGWLIRLVPRAAPGASQLRHLLTAPEMAELLAAAPQAGRILRPLCRMLGVALPQFLVLPKRPPRKAARRPRRRRAVTVASAGRAERPARAAASRRPPPLACGPPRLGG